MIYLQVLQIHGGQKHQRQYRSLTSSPAFGFNSHHNPISRPENQNEMNDLTHIPMHPYKQHVTTEAKLCLEFEVESKRMIVITDLISGLPCSTSSTFPSSVISIHHQLFVSYKLERYGCRPSMTGPLVCRSSLGQWGKSLLSSLRGGSQQENGGCTEPDSCEG